MSSVYFIPPGFESMQKFEIHVLKDRCKGCEFCVTFCPREILELSDEFNEKGYHPPRLREGVTSLHCSGCKFCEIVCPEFAIFVVERKDPSDLAKEETT